MKLPWHPLVESGDDFLASARFRYVNTVDVPVPANRAWAALTADNTLVSWSWLVSGLRWTTPRPFRVGTTREITLLRCITARERYYRWDEGHRKTFTGVQVSVPGIRRLVEDYVVEPTPVGSRLIWTLALQPHPVLKPVLIVLNPLAARMIRSVARGMPSQVG